MTLPRLLLAASLGVACQQATPETACDTVCTELVSVCKLAAYPSLESCVQGCAFEAELGVDVAAQGACIADAECNTFAIVECDHAFASE